MECQRPRWLIARWTWDAARRGRAGRCGPAKRLRCRRTSCRIDPSPRHCRRLPAPGWLPRPRPRWSRPPSRCWPGPGVPGTLRSDSADPDWFLDPVTGRRAPAQQLAFGVIHHRDEKETGNIKQVWEMSRHHHITVLAAAWWLTGEERYAEAAARQLRSWWVVNPFLTGVHWTSGIEAGVRLISWVWTRRLLDEWPKVGDLFEYNDDAVRQIAWHQEFLDRLPQPRLLGQQPRDRRGGGPAGGGVRVPLVLPHTRLATERGCPAGARARREHVRRRTEPGARDRLPPFRPRARPAGRSRSRPARRRALRGDLAVPGADARCRRRDPGCHRPGAAAG